MVRKSHAVSGKSKLKAADQMQAQQIIELRNQIADLKMQLDTIYKAKLFKVWQRYCAIRLAIKVRFLKSIKFGKELIPLWLRKRIKAKLKRFFREQYKLSVDSTIGLEWAHWDKTRPPSSFDILIFGITNFNFRYQRPHHLASELHRLGHRIFYIETEFIQSYKQPTTSTPFKVERYHNNFYLVTLSSYENSFIYHDKLTDKNKEVMLASIRLLIDEAAIVNPIAKFDHPFWGALRNDLAMPTIYDCMDEHSGFRHSSHHTDKSERELMTQSDLVIASSDYLYHKIAGYKPKKLLSLKNAGEFVHFRGARYRRYEPPKDIASLPRPIIGYYGAITDWMDDTIIRQLARDNQTGSIVLIGHIDNIKIARIKKEFKNVHLLGEKSYQLLPHYLQEFDVCLIPFLINELIKATSPVKVYEYLSAGKPVVATDIPELQPYKHVLYIAKTPKEFSEMVKKALLKQSSKIIAKRQMIAKRNTWRIRGQVLHNTMTMLFFPKVSVVVLTYLKPKYTKLCIDSILHRSKYPNFELIIVDNGSDKKTVRVIKSFENDTRVKITLNKINYGFSKGNNIGMRQATGDYIVLFNNDAVATPGWISRLVFHIRKKGVGLVGPVTNGIGNEAKISIIYDDNLSDMERAARNYTSAHWGETLELKNLAAFCWILTKSLYKKIGGFDEQYATAYFEDDDYCMMVKKQGLKLLCADDVFIHHYWGSTGKTIDDFLAMQNRKRFERKWRVTWQPHTYRNQ